MAYEPSEPQGPTRAVALLGRRALAGESIEGLLELSVDLVRGTLGVDFATVVELQPDGETLLLKAGAGWEGDVVGRTTVRAGLQSQSGYTLQTGGPVHVEDLREETRFRAPGLAQDHGIVSGLSVVIEGSGSVYGVLIAHSRERRAFTREEVGFLQAVADVLAQAIRRRGADAKLRFQTQLLDAVGEAVIATDLDGSILYWNRRAEELYGWTASEAIGRNVLEITPSDQSRDQASAIFQRLEAGESWSGEFEVQRRDGTRFPAHVTDTPMRDADGRLVGIVGVSHDLTEHKALEQQFRQAQRMEAVGRLAGGIAHDFNNLLTVILGYTQILMEPEAEGTPSHKAAQEVLKAAGRAAELTEQLLAFSRKQVVQPRALDLGKIVQGMETMLRRLLGEDVELAVEVEAGLGAVHADPGQVEQVVMNLAVNARDAMPRGGRLLLSLANLELEGGHGEDGVEIPAGAYVRFTARDHGVGMTREVMEHAFEPFYTTKEKGKGTGLGLSTVYGIVKQSDGYVRVKSELGKGTTFEILLPRVDDEAAGGVALPKPAGEVPRGREETVLIVEDEPGVRSLARDVLVGLGYRVLESEGPSDALRRVLPGHPGEIDLLLTDVVMPGTGGPELARRVAELRPGVRTLFMSGYAEDEVTRREIQASGGRFLEKPFTPDALGRKVREVLDSE